MTSTTNFQIKKANFFESAFATNTISDLEDGAVLFKVEKYAFTANNITYAVFGERLRYWDFFPTEADWGILPVWGFAEIIESKHATLTVGERFYGYFPMSEYLKVEPAKVTPYGFADGASHRAELSPIYNYYHRISQDVSYQEASEDFMPILRPLFSTSFLSYYFLKDAQFFDGDTLFLTSASSKTALGLAYLLKEYQKEHGKNIVGLTSKRNVAFVEQTGFYDEVYDYENYASNLPQHASILVDFAGNADLLQGIIDHMGDHMKYISLIGFTDWQSGRALKNPIAQFFFAPDQIQKLYKEWGVEVTNRKIAENLAGFTSSAKNWIELTYVRGNEEIQKLYQQALKGDIDPKMGYVIVN